MTHFKHNFSLIPLSPPIFSFSSQQSKTRRYSSTKPLQPKLWLHSPRERSTSVVTSAYLINNTLAFTLPSRTTCPAVTLRPDTATTEPSGQLFRPRYVTHTQMPPSSSFALSPCEMLATHCSPTVLSTASIDLHDKTEEVGSCVGTRSRGSAMLARKGDEQNTS